MIVEVICRDCAPGHDDWRQPFPDEAKALRWIDEHADRFGHEHAEIVDDS